MRCLLLPRLSFGLIAVAAASVGLDPTCSYAGPVKTVAYASLPGVPKEQTSVDLYPCSVSADALVLYVHGGAWIKGDKANVYSMPNFFVKNNVCFASANYPLVSPGGTPLIDLQMLALSGLDVWLQSYGRQASRRNPYRNISLIGHSAGAHLVALLDKQNGWNQGVKNLFLMDSGSYDIEAKIIQAPPRYRQLMPRLMQLDMNSPMEPGNVFKRYSPASLPPRQRNSSRPLNVFLLTSQGQAALSSAVSLQDSYGSAPGYNVRLYELPWRHRDFPRKIGVDQSFSQKLLGRISATAP